MTIRTMYKLDCGHDEEHKMETEDEILPDHTTDLPLIGTNIPCDMCQTLGMKGADNRQIIKLFQSTEYIHESPPM